MDAYRPYPAIKDSGIEWLGQIPAHWDLRRLKFVLRERLKYGANEVAQFDEPSWPRYIRITDIGPDGSLREDTFRSLPPEKAKPYLLQDGDILLARSGATVGKTFKYNPSWGTACFAGYLILCRVDKRIANSDFVYYFTQSDAYLSWKDAIFIQATIQNISAEKYYNLSLGIPPIPEQRAIAAFLDRETARIDTLIAKKRELIDLLQRQRVAVISHAVTKGLDPSAPLKDSGIEWLGQIPAHWDVERNKWLFREVNERLPEGQEDELLTVSHITGVTRRAEKEVYMFLAETLVGYKVCHPGDLVINTMWAWMGALGVSFLKGVASPSYNVYRPGPRVFPRYYDYLCRSPQHVFEINRWSKGVWSSRLRLYPKEFFSIRTPLPPLEEQRAIAAFLDRETARIDRLVAEIEASINLLQRQRTALISAAVTGKIDVREQK